MLVHFKKAFPLTSLGTHLKEELTVYCFVLKPTTSNKQCCLLIFIYVSKKPCLNLQKPCLYLQQAGNKLLNMFFHRCSYKISCFSELAYNSSVLVLIF